MHWIENPTYGMVTCLNNKFIPLEYDYAKMETVDFHEAFAQLFTHFYLEWQVDKKKIFDWLDIGQPPQYKKYQELLTWGIKSSHDGIKLLSFMRLFNYQSFANIENWISCLNELKWEESFIDTLSDGGLLKILEKLPIKDNKQMKCVLNDLFSHDNIQQYISELFKRLDDKKVNDLSSKVAEAIGGDKNIFQDGDIL